MICANPLLMQLNAVLDEAYITSTTKQSKNFYVRYQKSLLHKKIDICTDIACLETLYKKSIQEVSRVEKVFIVHPAASEWDIIISTSGCGKKMDDQDVCKGPATVDIFARDSSFLSQRIEMPAIYLLTNDILAENGPSVVVEDFNFDGHSDLALRNGSEGAYNSPSYDIYLYDSIKKQFIRSAALTELASHNTGLFLVDTEAKTLKTFRKISPTRYLWSKYNVIENTPILVEAGGEAWRPRDMPGAMHRPAQTERLINEIRNIISKYSMLLFFCFYIIAIPFFILYYMNIKQMNKYMLLTHKEKWERMKGFFGGVGIENQLFIFLSNENFDDHNVDIMRKKIRRYALYFIVSVCCAMLCGISHVIF